MPEPTKPTFIPALRYGMLTPLYDRVVAWATRDALLKRRVARVLGPQTGERILDVGCGTGTLAIALAQSQAGITMVGVDADATILAIARRKAEDADTSVRFEQGLAQALPFPDASFDAAVSSLMFHHLDAASKEDALAELRRVLRPGGRLLIADFGRAAAWPRRLAFDLVRLLDGFSVTRDHALGRLAARMVDAGFAEVRIVETLPVLVGSIDLVIATMHGARWRPQGNT
jgi:SAM-dependent methyltransferase